MTRRVLAKSSLAEVTGREYACLQPAVSVGRMLSLQDFTMAERRCGWSEHFRVESNLELRWQNLLVVPPDMNGQWHVDATVKNETAYVQE